MSEPLLLTQTLIAYCPEHSSGLSPASVTVEAKYISYTPRSEYFEYFLNDNPSCHVNWQSI